jgi:hypothetical protein
MFQHGSGEEGRPDVGLLVAQTPSIDWARPEQSGGRYEERLLLELLNDVESRSYRSSWVDLFAANQESSICVQSLSETVVFETCASIIEFRDPSDQ